MKTFLNVLYRRILYKIPLKFLLILLAVCAVLFASFSDAVDIIYVNDNLITPNFNSYESNVEINHYLTGLTFGNKACFVSGYPGCTYGGTYDGEPITDILGGQMFCFERSKTLILSNKVGRSCPSAVIGMTDLFAEYINPTLTSAQCQYQYDLMPVSDCNSYYCQNNNLCPIYTGDCENSSGLNWSSLYINNIQHIGGPNIYIDIPEELSRDYDYIDEDMYIDVEGYNVDYDKITGIIDVQNYKPSQEDFNNVIGILADFMPIIVIFLGLLFIYKMIRKPFKSKL